MLVVDLGKSASKTFGQIGRSIMVVMAAFPWSFAKCVHHKVLAPGPRSTCVADYLSYRANTRYPAKFPGINLGGMCAVYAHLRPYFGAPSPSWLANMRETLNWSDPWHAPFAGGTSDVRLADVEGSTQPWETPFEARRSR